MDLNHTSFPANSFDIDFEATSIRSRGKYHQSIQSLKPIRFTSKHKAPIDNSGLFSIITLSWLSKTLYRARKNLKFEDIPPISSSESVATSAPRLIKFYKEERDKKGDDASIGVAMYRFVRTRFWFAVILSSISFVIALIAPALIVNELIIYSSTTGGNIGYGVGLCFAMLGSDLARTLTNTASWAISVRTLVRTRNAVAYLLYWKLIRLKSFNQKSAGEMINLLVNDLQRIVDFLVFSAFMCSAPVGIVAGTIYAGFVLGWTAIMGLIGYFLLIPIQGLAVKFGVKYRASSVLLTDRRVRIMNEILNCIKMIKFYAWEASFSKVIGGIRKREQGLLVKIGALQIVISGLIPIAPIYVTVLTLLLHTGLGYPLTAAQAFTTMVIFNSMRLAVGVLPIAIKAFTEALVAVDRFNEMLKMEQVEEYQISVADNDHAIELTDLTVSSVAFQKPKEDEPREKPSLSHNTSDNLKNGNGLSAPEEVVLVEDINLNVKRGRLIGICGAVGSGKSSLISSILGQVRIQKGTVGINGNMAFVPQQAWIFHASLRENVLFGLPFDAQKYEQTIRSCALQPDIDLLPNGDLTEIGERGINLSGGQKQRVSLARAVYSDRDIVLLDDPLSAVDAHVGKHIFDNCIKQQLAGKTVVLVSHQLQFFKECDSVVMLKGGRIVEHGSYAELMKANNIFSELIRNFHLKVKSQQKQNETESDICDENCDVNQTEDSPIHLTEADSPTKKESNHTPLTVEESQEFGSVQCKTYQTYIKAMGGYVIAFLIFLHTFVYMFLGNATTLWFTFWINEGGQLLCPNGTTETNITFAINSLNCTRDTNIVTNPKRGFYQMIYGIILLACLLALVLRAFSYPYFVVRASSNMHKKLFQTIMRCPMAYFDRTPVGQILNRFSKDIDEMDNRLLATMNSCMQVFSLTLISFVTICFIFPYFLIAFAVLLISFLLMFNIYRSGIREVKRYENVYRSPWITHVDATVYGLSSIHAYQKTEVFVKNFGGYIDTHANPFQAYYAALQWVNVRLDVFNIVTNFVVAVMVVVATTYPDTFGIGQGSALAGLALTYSVQISGILQAMIRFFIQTETYFTSAERVREYAEISKLEKPAIVDGNRPLENWPNNGNIRFENVSMRYREDLPLVLREVDIIIKAKEKIGIVGRTGSGKSSLGIALFRLMELSEGRICIDGFDTSEIGLEDLRKKMTIIPQDPVLFVGSIRYNLDPFQQHSDEEIWKAVERSHIKELINRLPQKLENEVVENGENFSVGERQLLCMARAILRHSKIIVLDEATAAIDSETDSLVQDTIREAFADCTVLTIAHRLNTILNCNKIIVMQDGQVAEFGETQELMKNGQSKFSHLLAAGLKSGEEIVAAKSTNIHNKNNSNNTTACYINPSYTSTS